MSGGSRSGASGWRMARSACVSRARGEAAAPMRQEAIRGGWTGGRGTSSGGEALRQEFLDAGGMRPAKPGRGAPESL